MCDREHCPLGDKYDFLTEDKNFIDKIRKHLVVKLDTKICLDCSKELFVKLIYKDDGGEEYIISCDSVFIQ
jgi:hypothetical protein